MSLLPTRACLAALGLAVALVPVAAKPADAATKKHHHHRTARSVAKKTARPQRAAAEATTPAPAAAPAPAVTSVISIGGYVFYDVTYAQAVAAHQALVATAPAGSTPPAVTSVSVTTTVGGTA